jgi:hypothetical protein
MYNFNAHTLNGVPVSYSALPNFALEYVERDERLTLASKMIYMRLLRYASMLKDTAFKITGNWICEQLALNRHTVSRSLVQLKQCGYVTDKGIIIPTSDTAKKVESVQAQNSEIVSDMVAGLLALVGSSKAKIAQKPVKNAPQDVANCAIDDVDMSQIAPSNVAKIAFPLRIKKRIKKRIMARLKNQKAPNRKNRQAERLKNLKIRT